MSSCGGILAEPIGGKEPFRDLLTGAVLVFEPYREFRCSGDRKTVVGTGEFQNGALVLGLPPTITVADIGTFDRNRFNISPDGSTIAYLGNRICVFGPSRQPVCTQTDIDTRDLPSVNNSGEVLVTVATDQECFYRTPSHFSPAPFAGATDESRDQCLAIGHWKAGTVSISVVEAVGRDAQWVTVPTARLLRAWATTGK